MIKLFWQTVKLAPVLFAASLFAVSEASAQTISAEKETVDNTLEQIDNYQKSGADDLSQVTNVNQLRDVSPTDWAYEALRSLVDRYGCISGFPNQTYRGNQPLSRYEFAAGLNSCLNQIERLIAANAAGPDEAELETITRLTQEFEAELATIGGRVDELESRTAVLEDSQFSTTTKLKGEAIFSLNDAFGGGINSVAQGENILVGTAGADGFAIEDEDDIQDADVDLLETQLGATNTLDDDLDDDNIIALNFIAGQNGGDADFNGDGVVDEDDITDFEDESELDDETTFSSRVRLNFDSSFFGKDRLRARLEAGNITDYGEVTGTDSARLGYDSNNDFDVELTDLHYRFPFGEKIVAWVGPQGLDLDDIFAVTNPMLESSGTGALSRFSRRNPLLFRGTEGAGAGINLDLVPDKVGFNFGYLTDDAFDSEGGDAAGTPTEGLFGGSFSAGGQLEFTPFEALELSATYVRNYQTAGTVDDDGISGLPDFSGSTVNGNAVAPFGNIASTADKIGVGANLNIGERIVLAGFGGYAKVNGILPGEDNNPNGDVWTWGANLSFLDIIKEGSQLSLAGGMVPKFISDLADDDNQAALAAGVDIDEDQDTSYLVEALYKFPLNDNILITPGAYVVFNPNHIDTNDTVVVGTLRTTFSF